MEQETVTDPIDSMETEVVEVEDEGVNPNADVSEEEFDRAFETDEPTEEPVEELDDEPTTLDDRYASQLGNRDMVLDKPVLIKYNGEVMEVSNLNELRNLAEKGFNSTQKYQKLADDRKKLEARLLELGDEPEPLDTIQDELDDISNGILSSSYADVFQTQIDRLPKEAINVISDPAVLRNLAIDYDNGIGEKIMAEVPRLMAIKGLSFEHAYQTAGNALLKSREQQELDKPRVDMLKAEPTKTSNKVSNDRGRVNIDNMSNAEFDKYFAEM